MKRIILACVLILGVAFGGSYLLASNAIDTAQAEGAAMVDAGPLAIVVDAGPAVAPAGSAPALPDVTVTQPQVVIKVVRDVREREGLWAAIAAVLYMLLTAMRTLKSPAFEFLKRGRTPALIAGITGLVGSGYEYLTGYLTGYAVLGAAIVAVTALINAVYMTPADPTP